MSARSFHSVFMVASCAGAALGCYLVSLRVASERAQLEDVETKIVVAQQDMRLLQTEIGTRGRLSQLERWNAGAFALAAPAADQFVKGGFELARLAKPEKKIDFQAPVVLASAPAAPAPKPVVGQPETDDAGAPTTQPVGGLLHQASYKIPTREVPARQVAELAHATAKAPDEPATVAKPALKKSAAKPDLAAAHPSAAKPVKVALARPKLASKAVAASAKKSVDKPQSSTARSVTKPIRIAKVDPLAPLPAKHLGHNKDVAAER
jgi:hypothetical protein